MSFLPVSCPACGTANDPGVERCHLCAQPLHRGEVTEDRPFVESQQQALSPPLLQPPMGSQWSMSRRAMLWGIAASAIVLPVVALGSYLTYQHLTDQHVLTYDAYHGAVVDAAWSHDGTRIAVAGWDTKGGSIQIVQALTGERLATCAPTTALFGLYPQRVLWSGDGRQVLSFVALDHNMII